MWNVFAERLQVVYVFFQVVYGTVPPTFLAQALTNCCFVQQGDVLKMNPNLEDFHDDYIDLLKEPAKNKQTICNEERNKVKKTT